MPAADATGGASRADVRRAGPVLQGVSEPAALFLSPGLIGPCYVANQIPNPNGVGVRLGYVSFDAW